MKRLTRRFMWAALGAGALCGWLVARATRADPTPTEPPVPINAGTCDFQKPPTMIEPGSAMSSFMLPPGSDGEGVVALLNSVGLASRSRDAGTEWQLRGRIDAAATAALAQRLSRPPAVRALRVSSFGGDSGAAIELAGLIDRHELVLIIDTVCASACANYLLPAAPRAEVNGIVLMHGSPAGCQQRLGTFGSLARLGLGGTLALRASAERQTVFEQRHPHFKHWIERSATESRGDPSGQLHGWLQIPPAELEKAHPNLTLGPGAAAADNAYRQLVRARRDFGDVYTPGDEPAPNSGPAR